MKHALVSASRSTVGIVKPLMKGTSSSMLYKPNQGDDEQYGEEKAQEDFDKLSKTNRFQPDKGFSGADGGGQGSKRPRDTPVEFEKEAADPFGLDQFLSEAKKGKKAMDGIASGNKGHGHMSAGAGGGWRWLPVAYDGWHQRS